ncbi:MAG: alpha/beta hydrolase fold domain-containing protein [Anaerolineaceae bacterium]
MAKLKGLNPDWIDTSPAVPQARTEYITRQTREIPYGDDPLQKLDIYLPEEGKGPFPVIVNVHGGGFSVCDKHDFHLYPTMFALQQGFAVAAVNYRLSPAVHYPEHYFDLERALLWIRQHGAEKNLDTNNIFLWGTSAGGNLVLQAGMEKGIPLPAELSAAKEVSINAVAALCPGIDLMHYGNTGTFLERLMVRILFFNLHKYVFGTKQVSEEAARQSNPTTYIQDGIVPLYLQQGTLDPAVPFASVKEFYEKLTGILPPEDLVFDALEGAPHAGADEAFFLEKNVNPILRFFERHMCK